jgi:exopolysaccharide biosynthesis polyprenyl glycosylphosphotransferase
VSVGRGLGAGRGVASRRPTRAPTPFADLARDPAFGARLQALTLWRRRVALLLFACDVAAVGVAVAVGYQARFSYEPETLAYPLIAGSLFVAWLVALNVFHCYEPRLFGVGTEEFRRVLLATFALFGALAIIAYTFKLTVPRGFVAVALPVGLLLLLLGRAAVRRGIQRSRRGGRLQHRVVVVGNRLDAQQLVAQVAREPNAGFDVVGVCLPEGDDAPGTLPVLGGIGQTLHVVRQLAADTVAIAQSPEVTPADIKAIAWSLEGSGVDLVVAPAVTDVAGPRISIRPVGGLPLLYVDEPTFTGATRVLKRVIDVVGAGLGLLLLSPLLVGVAVAVRLTSRGPALFRQTRIGRDGGEFRVFKFRTMHADAEGRRDELLARNETDGLLFKITDDPRVTPIGRFLRRTSVDELPQLINVLAGDMSLVGPRPLPIDDSDFQGHVRRRLLVRPGITGLWQVSGRSDISWDDAVRLDLYYVENWSLTLDFTILIRTVLAVWRGEGAY